MKTLLIIITLLYIGCSLQCTSNNNSQDEIDYFIEIALGAEFGDEVPVIKKWTSDVRIKVSGEPTVNDIQTLNSVITDLNELVSGIKVKLVDENENLSITFSPESEFAALDPNYVPKNYGFFWALWHDDEFVIYDARILVASADISQQERSHLIREELTQSLGLMNDSDKYNNSVFYQSWTDVTEYSALDKTVIRTLYQKNIKPGMTKEQTLNILN